MSRLALLLQAPSAERDARQLALEAAGHQVITATPEWTDLRAALDQHQFDALIVDCSTRPSHSRECALYLAERQATRDLPLFLVGVKPDDVAKTKAKLPSARFQLDAGLAAALTRVPLVPKIAKTDPTAAFRKRFDLGESFVLVGRGVEFRAALTRGLGESAKFQTTVPRTVQTAVVELPLDAPDLKTFFEMWRARIATDGALWVISPKKEHAKAEGSAHTWDAVQQAALTTDLVDNKIAAFSDNLTATRFVIRKERRGGGSREPWPARAREA